MRQQSILIVTHAADDHVPLVEAELIRLGTAYIRFNTDDCMESADVLCGGGHGPGIEFSIDRIAPQINLTTACGSYHGQDIAAVLFRHIKPYQPVRLEDPDAARFAASEISAALEGAVLTLEPALWINHPQANQNTRNKVLQLRVAAQLGFDVPDTIVTRDPARIRERFAQWSGQMVAKLAGGQLVGPSVDAQYVIHTTKITTAHLANDAALSAAPAIYQRLIAKAYDVRVTVIGEKLFACRIASQARDDSAIDWRAAGFQNLDHRVFDLPPAVQSLCRDIVRRFGLHTAGIDLIERPDGAFTFLEINASGQWAWIEKMTGLPIAAEFARQLSGAARRP
ncbi:MAG: MvdC/MvdD family ATP grasp protein [Hyphomicrobium sp.]